MKASPRRFNLLVFTSDGRHIVRLSLSRWAAWTALGSVVSAVLVGTFLLGALSGDYLTLKRERASAAFLFSRLADQQAVLDRYRRGMAEVRAEIETWRDIYAKIWEPFGPEAGPRRPTAGIGGRTMPRLADGGQLGLDELQELARLSRTVEDEGQNLRSLESFLARASKAIAALPSRWPLQGSVNSEFGNRRSPWAPNLEFHGGIDIAAAVGSPVHAPAPGVVIFANRHPEFGLLLLIDHGQAITSLYGHLSRLNVAVNQRVERGSLLAWSGNTGRSSGPHLHYEIQVNGQPVNPHTYFWE